MPVHFTPGERPGFLATMKAMSSKDWSYTAIGIGIACVTQFACVIKKRQAPWGSVAMFGGSVGFAYGMDKASNRYNLDNCYVGSFQHFLDKEALILFDKCGYSPAEIQIFSDFDVPPVVMQELQGLKQEI